MQWKASLEWGTPEIGACPWLLPWATALTGGMPQASGLTNHIIPPWIFLVYLIQIVLQSIKTSGAFWKIKLQALLTKQPLWIFLVYLESMLQSIKTCGAFWKIKRLQAWAFQFPAFHSLKCLSFVPEIPYGNPSGTPRKSWNFFLKKIWLQSIPVIFFHVVPRVTISHQKTWPNLDTSQIGK